MLQEDDIFYSPGEVDTLAHKRFAAYQIENVISSLGTSELAKCLSKIVWESADRS